MNFKKRVNGSWTDTPHYVHSTSTDTITTLPADIYANDTTATVGLKGNMSQSGTPTPDNLIMPQGTGERTGNLFPLDENKLHVGCIENDGTIAYEIGTITIGTDSVTYEANTIWRGFYTDFIQVNENEKLTISLYVSSSIAWSCNCYDENDTFLGKASAQSTASIRIFTPLTGTKKVRISVTSSSTVYTISQPMLNLGSTALPYEPYGIKIPISSAGQTNNIYLGEVQTTRRVKKLVLTGEEAFTNQYGTNLFSVLIQPLGKISFFNSYCTHYKYNPVQSGLDANTQNGDFALQLQSTQTLLAFKNTAYSSAADFKSYLAAQYAAGTPVTVWYVLAEPETGIVNEPLRKIGDYADEVSGITIPTIAGANTIDIDTTLKPSEVTVNYHGWHPVADVHEAENGQWN